MKKFNYSSYLQIQLFCKRLFVKKRKQLKQNGRYKNLKYHYETIVNLKKSNDTTLKEKNETIYNDEKIYTLKILSLYDIKRSDFNDLIVWYLKCDTTDKLKYYQKHIETTYIKKTTGYKIQTIPDSTKTILQDINDKLFIIDNSIINKKKVKRYIQDKTNNSNILNMVLTVLKKFVFKTYLLELNKLIKLSINLNMPIDTNDIYRKFYDTKDTTIIKNLETTINEYLFTQITTKQNTKSVTIHIPQIVINSLSMNTLINGIILKYHAKQLKINTSISKIRNNNYDLQKKEIENICTICYMVLYTKYSNSCNKYFLELINGLHNAINTYTYRSDITTDQTTNKIIQDIKKLYFEKINKSITKTTLNCNFSNGIKIFMVTDKYINDKYAKLNKKTLTKEIYTNTNDSFDFLQETITFCLSENISFKGYTTFKDFKQNLNSKLYSEIEKNIKYSTCLIYENYIEQYTIDKQTKDKKLSYRMNLKTHNFTDIGIKTDYIVTDQYNNIIVKNDKFKIHRYISLYDIIFTFVDRISKRFSVAYTTQNNIVSTDEIKDSENSIFNSLAYAITDNYKKCDKSDFISTLSNLCKKAKIKKEYILPFINTLYIQYIKKVEITTLFKNIDKYKNVINSKSTYYRLKTTFLKQLEIYGYKTKQLYTKEQLEQHKQNVKKYGNYIKVIC